MARAGLIPVVAILLMVLSWFADPGRAQDDCLAAPNAKAPQGSRWYFHQDPIKQRKCWHLRKEGQGIRESVGEEGSQTSTTAKKSSTVARQAPHVEPDARPAPSVPAALAAPGSTLSPGTIQNAGRAERQDGANSKAWVNPPSSAGAGSAAWPDPPSPAGAGSVVWPDPPALRGDALPEESTPNEKPNLKQEVPATADLSDSVTRNGTGGGRHVAKSTEKAVPFARIPVGVFLVLGSALIIAGIFVGSAVRRRTLRHKPRGSISSTGTAAEYAGDEDRGVKEGLSKILRELDRQPS
jgi:hypothetical protein